MSRRQAQVGEAGGSDDFCMSLAKCTSSGTRADCAMVRSARANSAIGAAFIGRLDGLDGGLELVGILHGLASCKCTREPTASTWPRSPRCRFDTALKASCLARARWSP